MNISFLEEQIPLNAYLHFFTAKNSYIRKLCLRKSNFPHHWIGQLRTVILVVLALAVSMLKGIHLLAW